MNRELRSLLDKVESVPDFSGVKIKHINDTNSFGDNALHCVCIWGDLEAAKLLVENKIDIEQKGEGGFTPLKVAHDFGRKEISEFLISKGANPEAISAKFQFNATTNKKHMEKLESKIENLTEKVDAECGKNA